jgi:hypothetical protein
MPGYHWLLKYPSQIFIHEKLHMKDFKYWYAVFILAHVHICVSNKFYGVKKLKNT